MFIGLALMEGQPGPSGQWSQPGALAGWRSMQLHTRAPLGPLKANSPPRSVITQNVGPFHLPSALLSLQLSLCCYALIQAAHTLLPPKSLELCSIENKSSNIFISRGESSFHLPAWLKPRSSPRTQFPSPSGCRVGRRDSLFPPTMAFPNCSSSTHI